MCSCVLVQLRISAFPADMDLPHWCLYSLAWLTTAAFFERALAVLQKRAMPETPISLVNVFHSDET